MLEERKRGKKEIEERGNDKRGEEKRKEKKDRKENKREVGNLMT